MPLTYDEMTAWIERYFAAFNLYGQDPDEIHRMDEYFAKDFVFNPFIAHVGKVAGRDNWYKVLTSHPSGHRAADTRGCGHRRAAADLRRPDQDRAERPGHRSSCCSPSGTWPAILWWKKTAR